MKALVPGAKVQLYKDHSVSCLPVDINAAGVRAGAGNELYPLIGLDHTVGGTGHDCTSKSALFEYLDPSRPLANLCSTILAGHPSLPLGQIGVGPAPASFEGSNLDSEAVDRYVAILYGLTSASPPMVLKGGLLYPATLAAAASQSEFTTTTTSL